MSIRGDKTEEIVEEIVFEHVTGFSIKPRKLCPYCKNVALTRRILFQFWELSCEKCGYKEGDGRDGVTRD